MDTNIYEMQCFQSSCSKYKSCQFHSTAETLKIVFQIFAKLLKYLFHPSMPFVYRKQREKKENERQSRIRLNRRLDALRPETSSRGRHKMAENTPTVFDVVSLFINSSSDEQLLVFNIGYILSSYSLMVVPSCRRLN